MSTTDRFDPQPDVNYGKCRVCDATLDTEADARTHMRETFEARTSGNSGHSVAITNPTRKDRIKRVLADIIDEHLQEAYEKIDELVEAGHLTPEEVVGSYALSYDVEVGWEEYVKELRA